MKHDLGAHELIPREEILSRIVNLQRRMEEKEIDLALLVQNVDLFYFTGTIQNGYLLIPQGKAPIFFVQKDYGRTVLETPLKCFKMNSFKDLPHHLREHGLEGKRTGMELDVIPVALFSRIRDLFPQWEISSISDEVKELRSVKSDFEIRQIKASGQIITEVFSRVKDHLREGMSEVELDGILTSVGRSLGHQGFLRMRGLNQEMMNIHVLSGETAAISPFADIPMGGCGVTPAIGQGSSLKKINRDEPVVIDYGGGYNGYVTDETRVFVLGHLKDHFQRAYRVALNILQATEAFAKAGEYPSRIYERAVEIATREGLAENFMGYGEAKVSFVGHGLGLEINELPIISKGGRRRLQPGMVFAFEPKFVFPGEGAVGVELDYIVREDGLERVTRFPKEIVYV